VTLCDSRFASTAIRRWRSTNKDVVEELLRRRVHLPRHVGEGSIQAEVLGGQQLVDLATAEAAVTAYAGYFNYHRLHGELDSQTPAERFDGMPFTDLGFEHVPSLAPVAEQVAELLAA